MKPLLASAAAILAVTIGAALAPAHAESLTATWYTVSETDPDFNTQNCCGSYFPNEVGSVLGSDGLPVLNLAGNTGSYTPYYQNIPGQLVNDLSPSGEITWWSPSLNSNVTATGTTIISLPYANYSAFPPNGTGSNDSTTGYQAAVFSGMIDVPVEETVSFSVGADDDAFLYVGGDLVCSLGGVHGVSPATCTTQTLTPGDYSVELFYADIHQTGAGVYFDLTTADVTTTPTPSVPEPVSLALLGFARRRKSN
jgi:hypothetical protein